MKLTRSTERHKPAKTIRVKRRFYETIVSELYDLRARVKTLEQDRARYASVIHTLVNINGQDPEQVAKEQTPELFA